MALLRRVALVLASVLAALAVGVAALLYFDGLGGNARPPTDEVAAHHAEEADPAAAEAAPLPRFAWPPPKASAVREIPDKWLRTGPSTTLSDVGGKLEKALQLANYRSGEWSWYAVPGGFALATHLEQIEPDGTPLPGAERWNPGARSLSTLSLVDFVAALARAPEGVYRAVVFVVTSEPLAQTAAPPTEAQIAGWSGGGAPSLPRLGTPYGPDHRTWALVYQFRKRGKGDATLEAPSKVSAEQHLEKSGLWRPLSLL